jgi:hypothetical protein
MSRTPRMIHWVRAMNPDFWVMLNTYSSRWDKELLGLLRDHKFTDVTVYEASLGGVRMWTNNYPYAAFTVSVPVFGTVRPSRRTVALARELLIDDTGLSL